MRQIYAARVHSRSTHAEHITCTRQTSTSLELLRPCPASSCVCSPFPPSSFSRLWPEGLRGRRGRPARTTRTAWERAAPPGWSAKIGTSKQAAAEHRKTVCMQARHAHIAMHSAKQHRHRMPGMRYKASSALRTGRLAHAKCSRRPGLYISALDLRRQVRASALASP